jgi:hypothetical protein
MGGGARENGTLARLANLPHMTGAENPARSLPPSSSPARLPPFCGIAISTFPPPPLPLPSLLLPTSRSSQKRSLLSPWLPNTRAKTRSVAFAPSRLEHIAAQLSLALLLLVPSTNSLSLSLSAPSFNVSTIITYPCRILNYPSSP